MKTTLWLSSASLAMLFAFLIPLDDLIAEEPTTPTSLHSTADKAAGDGAPKTVQWRVLAPDNGKPFNDPFTKLTDDQRADLSYVVRVRRLIYEEKIEVDGVDAKEAKSLARKLKEAGIDIGWLMAQRERVRQSRGLQVDEYSKSVAKSMQSEVVTIEGYATPIRDKAGKVKMFLLTPTPAMCSHSSAPSPLHVIYVKSNLEQAPKTPGTPVIISGSLIAETNTTPLLAADGVQVFTSAYKMVPSKIQILPSRRRLSTK